jgi:hypothetical protein
MASCLILFIFIFSPFSLPFPTRPFFNSTPPHKNFNTTSPATMETKTEHISVDVTVRNMGVVHLLPDGATVENVKPPHELIASIRKKGVPTGIAEQFVSSTREFAKRYWIVDNSGSMVQRDGLRLVHGAGGKEAMIQCSRW